MSAHAYLAAHAFDQLLRVVADAVFEDGVDIFDIFDVGRRVALDENEVCLFAFCDGADAILAAEVDRAIFGGDSGERGGVGARAAEAFCV